MINEKDDDEMFVLIRYKRTDEERVRCFLVQETKRGIQVKLNNNKY